MKYCFFAWLENEDYIVKSPVRRIHKVKITRRVKETLTDENLEKLRNTCSNVRDLAILELLISTGMRVGELTRLNISDMNFQERSCIVLGIGIKKGEITRVFEKGFTGTNGRKVGQKSTGMGLYLCKKLCNKLGLRIELDSEENIGTEIRIAFPKSSFIQDAIE